MDTRLHCGKRGVVNFLVPSARPCSFPLVPPPNFFLLALALFDKPNYDTFCREQKLGIVNTALAIALSDAKMTRAELAEALGVSPATVSTWGGEFPKYAQSFLRSHREVLRLRALVVQQAIRITELERMVKK